MRLDQLARQAAEWLEEAGQVPEDDHLKCILQWQEFNKKRKFEKRQEVLEELKECKDEDLVLLTCIDGEKFSLPFFKDDTFGTLHERIVHYRQYTSDSFRLMVTETRVFPKSRDRKGDHSMTCYGLRVVPRLLGGIILPEPGKVDMEMVELITHPEPVLTDHVCDSCATVGFHSHYYESITGCDFCEGCWISFRKMPPFSAETMTIITPPEELE